MAAVDVFQDDVVEAEVVLDVNDVTTAGLALLHANVLHGQVDADPLGPDGFPGPRRCVLEEREPERNTGGLAAVDLVP